MVATGCASNAASMSLFVRCLPPSLPRLHDPTRAGKACVLRTITPSLLEERQMFCRHSFHLQWRQSSYGL
jgi:hypothetical protein